MQYFDDHYSIINGHDTLLTGWLFDCEQTVKTSTPEGIQVCISSISCMSSKFVKDTEDGEVRGSVCVRRLWTTSWYFSPHRPPSSGTYLWHNLSFHSAGSWAY